MRPTIAMATCAAWVAFAAACEQPPVLDGPETLDGARILVLRAEPPAVVPPASVTMTVLAFDERWRSPQIHWYVPRDPFAAVLDSVPERMDDPRRVADTWLYLGAGTQATVPLPPVPPEALPDSLYVDTVALPIVVSVCWDDQEVKGLYQLRVVLPELVERNLAAELGRAVAPDEVAGAVARRLNRNPRVGRIRFADAVDAGGGYGGDARADVKVRREEVAATPLGFASGFVGALRVLPAIDDEDLRDFPDTIAGEPGYNPLSLTLIRPRGENYPLSLTEVDWAVERGRSPPPLQPAFAVIFDGQGGLAYRALEIDAGAAPVSPHRGAFGSALVGTGTRLAWLRLESAALRDAIREQLGAVAVIGARAYTRAVAPHGVTLAATAVSAAVPAAAAAAPFDAWTDRPDSRRGLRGAPLALTATVLRIWEP